ncbi:MAG: DUF2442 domain-containing protein [Methylacidiphilales bacterium]|nr:DUF2442 domain-containing protein [Candidatus Methylacidiphilales bacterium]
MSATLDLPLCARAYHQDGQIVVEYGAGKTIRFAVSANRRLKDQPEAKLNRIEIGHFGLHWPDLDEDLSHAGIRSGHFGQS